VAKPEKQESGNVMKSLNIELNTSKYQLSPQLARAAVHGIANSKMGMGPSPDVAYLLSFHLLSFNSLASFDIFLKIPVQHDLQPNSSNSPSKEA
jgi:hypothetical protein